MIPMRVRRTVLEGLYRTFWALRLQHALELAPAPLRRMIWAPILRRQRKYCQLVPPDRLTATYRAALELLLQSTPAQEIGDYYEFGVYDGTSMSCFYAAATQLGLDHVRMFGFDSFAGLPSSAATDDNGHWTPGGFRCDYRLARQNLEAYGVDMRRVTLVRGYYDDTLTERLRTTHQMHSASVVMIDCDMYLSAQSALRFCTEDLAEHSVIVFDDWYPLAHQNLGEKRALDEFLQDNPRFEVCGELPSYTDNARIFALTRRPDKATPEPSAAERRSA